MVKISREPPYDFYTYFEKEESGVLLDDWYDENVTSDRVFEEAELADLISPLMKGQNGDRIEKITNQFIESLYAVANQDQQTEGEIATGPYHSPGSPKLESLKFTQSIASRSYSRDTNFYEESHLEQPLRIQHVVSDILSTAAYLFLGWDPLNGQKDDKTIKEIKANLYKNRVFWQKELKNYYSSYFQDKMELAFYKAEQLIQSQMEAQKWAFIQRLTLYATLIIAAVGKLQGNRMMLMFGLSASVVTILFMIIHYGSTSFKHAQQGADLRQSLTLAENLKNLFNEWNNG